MVPLLRLHAPSAGGQGSIPGQGTKSHMLQLRVLMLQQRLKMPQIRPEAMKYIKKKIQLSKFEELNGFI